MIQIEFEGRNPIDSDFHGIKQLLNQLFLKAHLNLSELTDVIISQSYVGSVVKQSEPEDDDSDEDEDDVNDVYGITSVINLTEKQVGIMADSETSISIFLLRVSLFLVGIRFRFIAFQKFKKYLGTEISYI